MKKPTLIKEEYIVTICQLLMVVLLIGLFFHWTSIAGISAFLILIVWIGGALIFTTIDTKE